MKDIQDELVSILDKENILNSKDIIASLPFKLRLTKMLINEQAVLEYVQLKIVAISGVLKQIAREKGQTQIKQFVSECVIDELLELLQKCENDEILVLAADLLLKMCNSEISFIVSSNVNISTVI